MSEEKKQVRVLLAKPGLDGHDRGVKLVAQALRNAGAEVIFLGIQCTAGQIVQAALQESVDVIGLSIFSGGHMTIIPRILKELKESGAGEIPVIVGGIIPPADAEELERAGVKEVFGPGCSTSEIVTAFFRLGEATR
jgi:methylmalonyl-CoA mutase C-terminal domain/subunit